MYIVFWDAEMQKFHELTYTGVSLPLLSRGASCSEWAHWNLGTRNTHFGSCLGWSFCWEEKVAVCFSSHNLAVVDWSPHGLHWRTMLCSQQLGGSPSPQPAITHFLSVSKSFTPPWPVAAKVLESHLPSPPIAKKTHQNLAVKSYSRSK